MANSSTLYFAYGSNLSPFQMKARCPDSEPLALAHLAHPWAWLINERGYANVVDTSKHLLAQDAAASNNELISADKQGNPDQPGVYGVLYRLPPTDEALLDVYEGVPVAYGKVYLPVTVVSTNSTSKTGASIDGAVEAQGAENLRLDETVEALVYVDYQRTGRSEPKAEYVKRMNRGIDEATEHYSLPGWYVEQVMRDFIPEGGWDGAGISSRTPE